MLFLCKLASIDGHFLRFCGSFFFSELFSFIKRSKAGACVQSKLTNLSHIKEPRIDSPWKRQVFKLRPGQSLISFPRHGYCEVFLVGTFFESFWFCAIWRVVGNLDDYVLRVYVICKTVWKLAVIYAPSLGCLWLMQRVQVKTIIACARYTEKH